MKRIIQLWGMVGIVCATSLQPLLAGIEPPVEPYIQRFQLTAIAEMERTGIPASIKLAQAILESDYGRSELAKKANNHFGIKCGGDWDGETYSKQDDERGKSCFRVYKNAEQSFVAHSNFLADPNKVDRYGFLFDIKSTDYKKWAKGLERAGYATSRTYAEDLIALIERMELNKYDLMRTDAVAAGNQNGNATVANKPANQGGKKPKDPFANVPDKEPVFAKGIFVKKNRSYIIAEPGDTPESIAERYGLSAPRLACDNEIARYQPFKGGQRVWLKEKTRRYSGRENSHRVQAGETLYDISQYYGVTTRRLRKINHLEKGAEPTVGARIYLKKQR